MSIPRPGPGAVLAKLWARGRTRGWGEVGRLAVDRLKEEIHSEDVLVFFTRETSAAPAPAAEPPTGLTFTRAEPIHADAYQRDIGTDSASTFRERLSEESRCYLVLDGDRVLHASWVTTSASWIRELRRYFRPPPETAYIYESFTRADARGRGVYPFALGGICADLQNDEFDRAWVAVEEDNPPSLKAVQKAGFRKAFTIDYRRRLGAISVGRPEGDHAANCSECFVRKIRNK